MEGLTAVGGRRAGCVCVCGMLILPLRVQPGITLFSIEMAVRQRLGEMPA
jgi:hypothetical protein